MSDDQVRTSRPHPRVRDQVSAWVFAAARARQATTDSVSVGEHQPEAWFAGPEGVLHLEARVLCDGLDSSVAVCGYACARDDVVCWRQGDYPVCDECRRLAGAR